MWRCKWTELKVKEIESQALKYARELTTIEQRKNSQIYQSTFEDFCSKSVPFTNQCYRRRAVKRRKRKRIEDTADATSYMLHHKLFSYLGICFFIILAYCGLASTLSTSFFLMFFNCTSSFIAESKRSNPDGSSMIDDFDNTGDNFCYIFINFSPSGI